MRVTEKLKRVAERARLVTSDPREAFDVAARTFALVRARYVFRGCACGAMVRVRGDVRVRPDGRIVVGARSFFMAGIVPAEIAADRGAELLIGDDCGFNYGVSIVARRRIVIGTGSIFGSMVRIADDGAKGTAPVTIGAKVWVAHGAVIEPGVTIGDRSVISAGSVVTQDVPPDSLAVGNPARAMPLELRRATR